MATADSTYNGMTKTANDIRIKKFAETETADPFTVYETELFLKMMIEGTSHRTLLGHRQIHIERRVCRAVVTLNKTGYEHNRRKSSACYKAKRCQKFYSADRHQHKP